MQTSDWDVLGVQPGASREEIKKAFRLRVKLYHPDLHPGDEYAAARMRELTRAYARLMSRRLDAVRSDRLFSARPASACVQADVQDPDYRRLVRRYAWKDLTDRVRTAAQLGLALVLMLTPLAGAALSSATVLPRLFRAAAQAASPCPQQAEEVLVLRADTGQILLVPLSSPTSR
ncbi:MAG: hypothetical protein KatS3mg024_0303 [Armatimonadota bacterium]|nr:MAG: hypothetical protein KatS3mg024_0303 [Armatimonadota bacterium]